MSNDPLDTNVNDIDLSMPRLPDGEYEFVIGECEVKRNNKDTGDNLVVPLKLNQEATSTDDEPLAVAQVVITDYIPITVGPYTDRNGKSRERTAVDVGKSIAKVARAAGVQATPRDIINSPALLNGKALKINTKIAKATDEFPETNRIKSYVIPKLG